MNIVLVGFMGCGKSTVARLLGRDTGSVVLDTDHLIVEKFGRSVADIFAEEGEAFFRQCETDILHELQSRENVVIATGGGIVENPANWPLLRNLGTIFFLDLPWLELQKRIASGSGRPLAGDGMNWQPVKQLWQRRLSAYRQADECISTAHLSVESVVREIYRRLEGK